MRRLAPALFIALLATACNAEPPAEAPPATQAQPASRPAETNAATQSAEQAPTRVAQAPAPPPQTDARFVAGQHYRVLNPAQPTNVAPGKVEVAEIFWYGCPHCYTLEPYMRNWKANKPEAAEFVQMPAALNPGWQPHARLFYAAKALGVFEQAHDAIFREIHVNRNPLSTVDSMVELLGRFEIPADQARDTLTSFAVESEVRKADTQVRRYRLTGVPAVVVNGKYVAGADTAGGYEQLLALINHLVALESSAPAQ